MLYDGMLFALEDNMFCTTYYNTSDIHKMDSFFCSSHMVFNHFTFVCEGKMVVWKNLHRTDYTGKDTPDSLFSLNTEKGIC